MQLIKPNAVHVLFDQQLLFSLESYLIAKSMFIDLRPAISFTLLSTQSYPTPNSFLKYLSSSNHFILLYLHPFGESH